MKLPALKSKSLTDIAFILDRFALQMHWFKWIVCIFSRIL